jgi:hypothetical protein
MLTPGCSDALCSKLFISAVMALAVHFSNCSTAPCLPLPDTAVNGLLHAREFEFLNSAMALQWLLVGWTSLPDNPSDNWLIGCLRADLAAVT